MKKVIKYKASKRPPKRGGTHFVVDRAATGIFIMEEIFKVIPDYPNYQVSNLGRVKSLKSNFIGVYWKKDRSKWCSQITINGRIKHLGYFETEIEASNAYQNYLKTIEWAI